MKHRDDYKYGPLIGYVFANDVIGLQERVRQGEDPNERDSDGRTPLIHAAIEGNLGIVKALLELGANVNARDRLGYSALHFAAQNFFPELAALLIEQGAEIDAEDIHGNTPLARATFESKGRGDMISILLRAGADRNHCNKHGQTPINLARLIANYNIAQFFTQE